MGPPCDPHHTPQGYEGQGGLQDGRGSGSPGPASLPPRALPCRTRAASLPGGALPCHTRAASLPLGAVPCHTRRLPCREAAPRPHEGRFPAAESTPLPQKGASLPGGGSPAVRTSGELGKGREADTTAGEPAQRQGSRRTQPQGSWGTAGKPPQPQGSRGNGTRVRPRRAGERAGRLRCQRGAGVWMSCGRRPVASAVTTPPGAGASRGPSSGPVEKDPSIHTVGASIDLVTGRLN